MTYIFSNTKNVFQQNLQYIYNLKGKIYKTTMGKVRGVPRRRFRFHFGNLSYIKMEKSRKTGGPRRWFFKI